MSVDVVCVGESMALVTPDPPRPLADGGPMRLDAAGAESTVASYLAQLGARAAWASAVGADPLGALLRTRIASYGVDVSGVVIDPDAPTGVYFKDPGAETTVYYYRAGSAASRLGPAVLDHLPATRILHTSGITPALSGSCAALVDAALGLDVVTSFDVNYRARLWPVAEAAPILAGLARRADVVFVGLDEAQTLWGVQTAADVRALLPEPTRVVVKDGAVGAWSDDVFVPAPTVDVVEPVGAGDAFAAGYLFGLLGDAAEADRLRLGHRIAGAALRVTGDVARLEDSC
ncbi:sugar kinase [Cryptosporangium aurantiacum]|uniref:2-dehydro-3-deoxygluconokinase n=1 Tax=Cryptosporangium aurantiacum TaxID=134849 RepID=A0A1M7QS20_9ACTN|nr:sugar kinase [Cryptosporangium aurantiacum]SHN34444.1 2-dehydro-3-deoxygluconokinase [Cryptosporangium aurantiacum]